MKSKGIYAWMEGFEFDPSEGITLRFTRETVKIVGRNLNAEVCLNVSLLNGILRNKVGHAAAMLASQQSVFIERIALEN